MRKKVAAAAVVATLALIATGCSGTAGQAESDGPAQISFLTGSGPDQGSNYTMQKLVDDYGQGATLEMEQLDASMDQRIQLLASQDKLPTFFQVGTPSQIEDLYNNGYIADLEPVLKELGVYDDLSPFSVSIIKGLYGGHLVGLPLEVAVEGFWYNKALFAEEGIEAPQTWDDLTAAAEKLNAAGVQPFATAGAAGWPVTRLVAGYIERSVGPDALSAVADGSAKFTDPAYVKGAVVISQWASKGYFGEAPGALDIQTAEDLFLQGKAGIYYQGSWATSSFDDAEKNKIGADNIGWFPIPAVSGGKGDVGQTPANVGLPMAVNAKTLTPQVKDFLKYLVENYGTVALKDKGIISGFATDAKASSPLVAETADRIAGLDQFIPWFEALQSPEGTSASQSGATALISGSLTPEAFMQQVQAAQ